MTDMIDHIIYGFSWKCCCGQAVKCTFSEHQYNTIIREHLFSVSLAYAYSARNLLRNITRY